MASTSATWVAVGCNVLTRQDPVQMRAHLALVGAALVWAIHFVVARSVREYLPPVSYTFWRVTLALVIVWPFVAADVRRHAAVLWNARGTLLVLGATGTVAFQVFAYAALARSEVLNVALVAATAPAVIAGFAWAFDGAKITPRQVAGIALSLGGVVLVAVRGNPGALLDLRFSEGDLWMAAAVPIWAVYSILLRRLPKAVPPLTSLAAILMAGWCLLVPLVVVATAWGERVVVNGASLAAVAYTGVFAGLLGFAWWNHGVAGIGSARSGPFLHLSPVISASLGILVLGETPAVYHVVGASTIGLGVLWAVSPGGRPRGSHRS